MVKAELDLTILHIVQKFSPVVPKLAVGPPTEGHKIDLEGREMINGT